MPGTGILGATGSVAGAGEGEPERGGVMARPRLYILERGRSHGSALAVPPLLYYYSGIRIVLVLASSASTSTDTGGQYDGVIRTSTGK